MRGKCLKSIPNRPPYRLPSKRSKFSTSTNSYDTMHDSPACFDNPQAFPHCEFYLNETDDVPFAQIMKKGLFKKTIEAHVNQNGPDLFSSQNLALVPTVSIPVSSENSSFDNESLPRPNIDISDHTTAENLNSTCEDVVLCF